MSEEKGIEVVNQYVKNYEDEPNTNLTLEQKYQQKFSDESPPLTDWIQSDVGFFLECSVRKPAYLDEFPPLTTYQVRNVVSKRTSQGYNGSRPSKKLVATLEPIGNYNEETGSWEGMKWYHYLELKNAVQLGCEIVSVGDTLWFKQKAVIKSYGEKIQKLKMTSKSESTKTFCKKSGNSN